MKKKNNALKLTKKLTPIELKFAEAILCGRSNTDAALECGYSEKSIQTAAYRMMQKPHVLEYIEERRLEIKEARRKATEVDDIFITEKLKEILDRCMQAQAVMKYDHARGELVQATDDDTGQLLFVFDSAGALRAAENLAKHIGYYELDNKQKQTVIRVGIVQQNNIYVEGEQGEDDPEAED